MPPMADLPPLPISAGLSSIFPDLASFTSLCTSPLPDNFLSGFGVFSRGYSFSAAECDSFLASPQPDGIAVDTGAEREAEAHQTSLRAVRDSRKSRTTSVTSFGSTLPSDRSQLELLSRSSLHVAGSGRTSAVDAEEDSAELSAPGSALLVGTTGEEKELQGCHVFPRSVVTQSTGGEAGGPVKTAGRAFVGGKSVDGDGRFSGGAVGRPRGVKRRKTAAWGEGTGAVVETTQGLPSVAKDADVGRKSIYGKCDVGVRAFQSSGDDGDVRKCDLDPSLDSDTRGASPSTPRKRVRKRKYPGLSEGERKAFRQAQNRQNAKKSRLRRIHLTEEYKSRAEALEEENKKLRVDLVSFADRLKQMQRMIIVSN